MIGWILLAALAVLAAVIAVRTAMFKPKAQPAVDTQEYAFDKDASVDALQKLVQCKTVSYNDKSLEDDAEFDKLISLLPGLYPKVFEVCSFRELPDRALLFRWPGKKSDAPSVMI